LFRIDKSLVENMGLNKDFIVIRNKDNIKEHTNDTVKTVQNPQPKKTIGTDQEILKSAGEEASAILENARLEAERIKEAAWQEGYEKGKEEAEQKTVMQVQAQAKAAMDFLNKLKVYKQNLSEDMRKSVLEISLDVAEKIVNIEMRRDDTIYIGIVKEAVAKFNSSDKFKLYVSRNEYDKYFKDNTAWLAEETGQDLLEVICDPHMQEGDCIVESDQSIICAGVALQLDKTKRLLEETQHV